MTTATRALPAGYRLRRPTVADASAVYRLVAAHDTAIVGAPDLIEDDVRDELRALGYDPATDGWLVVGPDEFGLESPVGFARVGSRGGSAVIDAEVVVHPADPGLAAHLTAQVEGRAAEIGADLGHHEVRVARGVFRAAAAEARALAGSGYALATTFSRLATPLDRRWEPPQVPAGVTVQVCGTDDGLRRAAHSVREAAFVDHFHFVPRTYEEWVANHEVRATTDWSQLWLACVDATPAGMLLASNALLDTDDAGFVLTLGVVPAARGRGLARLLLRTAFAEMRRRGRTQAMLGVDTGNTTGAVGLYSSLGMRSVRQIDVWVKALPTGSERCGG